MPKKKTTPPFLFPPNNIFQEETAGSLQKLENWLKKLINNANRLYNEAYQANQFYLKYPEKFIDCIRNYTQIKTIINNSLIQSDLIELYDLEACLAIIQAQLNIINTNPATKTQLNSTEQELEAIKADFDTFDTRITQLESDLKNTTYTSHLKKLLEDRDTFSARWNKDANERKAHSYYNLAETLKSKSAHLKNQTSKKHQLVTKAKKLLVTSVNLYKQAGLFDFAEQTEKQIDELNSTLNAASLFENRNASVKIDPAIPSTSDTLKSEWQVTNKTILLPLPTKNSVKISNSSKDQIKTHHRKRKRHSFDENASLNPAKKSKQFDSLESLWQAENKKIVKRFAQLKIDDNISEIIISLHQKLPIQKSADECRAIVHNNRAVTIITEDLQSLNPLQPEKLALLQKAKVFLEKSAEFYNQVSLFKKRDKIRQYIHCIESSLKNLASFISKAPTDFFPSIDEKKYRAKSIRTTKNIASKNILAYYTRGANSHFFKQSFEENALKDHAQLQTHQHYSLKRA